MFGQVAEDVDDAQFADFVEEMLQEQVGDFKYNVSKHVAMAADGRDVLIEHNCHAGCAFVSIIAFCFYT